MQLKLTGDTAVYRASAGVDTSAQCAGVSGVKASRTGMVLNSIYEEVS